MAQPLEFYLASVCGAEATQNNTFRLSGRDLGTQLFYFSWRIIIFLVVYDLTVSRFSC
jgi:hypothetical protein